MIRIVNRKRREASVIALVPGAPSFPTASYLLTLSPDGRNLTAVSDDDTVRVWSAVTGQQLAVMQGDLSFTSSLAFSPDGERIAATRCDGVKIWNNRGSVVAFFGEGQLSIALFSSDGARLIAHDDETLRDGCWFVWHRRRPEYWWGVAWLPEFWATLVFGVGLGWSVWRDRRALRAGRS